MPSPASYASAGVMRVEIPRKIVTAAFESCSLAAMLAQSSDGVSLYYQEAAAGAAKARASESDDSNRAEGAHFLVSPANHIEAAVPFNPISLIYIF